MFLTGLVWSEIFLAQGIISISAALAITPSAKNHIPTFNMNQFKWIHENKIVNTVHNDASVKYCPVKKIMY